jgi:monoamine oxidase
MADSQVTKTDVVIVGGGLSGLAAASLLKTLGKDFVLLEAKDRLGGRARTEQTPFGAVDVGAEYVGVLQRTIWHFLQKLGVPLVRTAIPTDERWVFQRADGTVSTFAYDTFPGGDATLAALGEIDELALMVRPWVERPDELPAFLAQYDQISIADWQPSTPMSPETRDAFYASLRAVLSIEPREASFLFLLHYAATAGGYSALIDASGTGVGPEDFRFRVGTSSLVDALAAQVGRGNIRLADPVTRIESGPDEALVTTAAGARFRAEKVIVALGPWELRPSHHTPIDLAFQFQGPDAEAQQRAWEARQALCAGSHHGMSLKAFVRYDRPFWTAKGLQGRSLCASAAAQPIAWTIDNTIYEDEARTRAASYSLLAFMAGDAARELLEADPATRQAAVRAQLVALFGEEAGAITDYFDRAMPGPAGVLAPDVLGRYGRALRTPVGRVHWASSESALDWAGYMDGALQAGLRAAGEVL